MAKEKYNIGLETGKSLERQKNKDLTCFFTDTKGHSLRDFQREEEN